MERKLFWKVYRKSGRGMGPRKLATLVRYNGLISDREEETGKPDKLKEVLTEGEKRLLNTAIYSTWCQIASDMENNARFGGFQLTNMVAVETCIDADHLLLDPDIAEGKEADALIERLGRQFDPSTVLVYLCSFIHLR